MAMKQQLVSIVNIMNRLNNVEKRLRKVCCESFTVKQVFVITQQCTVFCHDDTMFLVIL